MDIRERLVNYLEYKAITKYKFYQETGLSNGFLNKKGAIGTDNCEIICTHYTDISLEWLITGTGPMLKDEKIKENHIYKKNIQKSIPLVDVYAIGGFGSVDFAIEEKNIKDLYVLPIFKNTHIDFLIEVRGDSMSPRYSGGDIVACAIIKERNFIQWNRVHIICTKNQGIIIKRLKKSAAKGFVTALSDNKNYDPFELPEEEITGIALVVGGVCIE